jgi:tetratricopeptide (TPR) repeat protein
MTSSAKEENNTLRNHIGKQSNSLSYSDRTAPHDVDDELVVDENLAREYRLKMSVDARNCFVCEQVIELDAVVCPHCKRPADVSLLTIDSEEPYFSNEKDRLKVSMLVGEEGALKNYVDFLFDVAMKIRNTEATRGMELLKEIISLDENHLEARVKLSFRYVQESEWEAVMEVLTPVIKNVDATILQKQRAFNNLSVACHQNKEMEDHAERAAAYAEEGINLDGIGTYHLWDNYGLAKFKLEKYQDAVICFRRAYDIHPIKEFSNKLKLTESKAKKQRKRGENTIEVKSPISDRSRTVDIRKDSPKIQSKNHSEPTGKKSRSVGHITEHLNDPCTDFVELDD